MGSWGASTTDESKPKYLTTEEKKDCFANTKGWTVPAGGNSNPDAEREVLVAIGDLSGATKLGSATISSVNLVTATFDKSDGGTVRAVVNYNEEVDVTGVPRVQLTNSRGGANFNLSYASGTGTNRLTFTLVIPADDATTNAGDTLTIGVNALNLNSGTIKDKGKTVVSEITHSAGTGTFTVVA
jgi:hypothetical protein